MVAAELTMSLSMWPMGASRTRGTEVFRLRPAGLSPIGGGGEEGGVEKEAAGGGSFQGILREAVVIVVEGIRIQGKEARLKLPVRGEMLVSGSRKGCGFVVVGCFVFIPSPPVSSSPEPSNFEEDVRNQNCLHFFGDFLPSVPNRESGLHFGLVPSLLSPPFLIFIFGLWLWVGLSDLHRGCSREQCAVCLVGLRSYNEVERGSGRGGEGGEGPRGGGGGAGALRATTPGQSSAATAC